MTIFVCPNYSHTQDAPDEYVGRAAKTPASNVDIVALNLVHRAIIDDINDPGKAIAVLLESMARVSRNIGGDERAASADWHAVVSDLSSLDLSEVQPLVNRQELVIGDTWAQRWMLMHMAKHLFEKLERLCMESPAVSAIESIQYDESGTVESWRLRT